MPHNWPGGRLRVDSREALLKGGESGPAVRSGEPKKSLLIEAVQQTGEVRMPKGAIEARGDQRSDCVGEDGCALGRRYEASEQADMAAKPPEARRPCRRQLMKQLRTIFLRTRFD